MLYLYSITGLALVISFAVDRKKTKKAVKMAYNRFVKILPAFLVMIILVSLILFFVSDQFIVSCLGNRSNFSGVVMASLLGSVSLMPGFISFPLCGILLQKGVGYMVLSAFTTTLMMVGILTYPVEKQYFGAKVTIIRNTMSLAIALIVALSIGFFFGELN